MVHSLRSPSLLAVLCAGLLTQGCDSKSSRDDGDGDGFTFGDGDGTTGDGDGGGSSSKCGDYADYDQAGATRTWEFLSDYSYEYGIYGGFTEETLGKTTVDGVSVYEASMVYDAEIDSLDVYDYNATSYYTCDSEGLHIFGVDSWFYYEYSGGSGSSESFTRYDEPYPLVMPASLSEGDSWESEFVGTVETDGEFDTIDSYTSYEVTDSADVEVHAGTYKAMEIQSDYGDSSSRAWIAKGVGTVLVEDIYELWSE